MKRFGITLLVLFTLFLCRTQIFNTLIEYVPEKEIMVIELKDSYWKSEVDQIILSNTFVGIPELNDRIIELLTSKLQFGKKQTNTAPTKLRDKSVAHCVGYSALHASLLTYACKKLNFEKYKVSHIRGKVKFVGIELTNNKYGNFYKDHDFVKIENLIKDQYYFSDATIYELLKISRIKFNHGI